MTPTGMPLALYRSTSLVADLDKTLVKGRTANGMGKYFLMDELKRVHLSHAWLGLANYREVLRIAEEKGEAAGLEYFFDVVGRTGCATVTEFYDYAEKYIRNHSLPGAREFMRYIGNRMPTFISTMGSDLAATAARAEYGCKDSLGQPVYHGNGIIITKIGITMRDGKDKLEATEEMLRRHGLSIGESTVLGNDALDHESMKVARFALASPLADEETIELTKERKGLRILNYARFMEGLIGR